MFKESYKHLMNQVNTPMELKNQMILSTELLEKKKSFSLKKGFSIAFAACIALAMTITAGAIAINHLPVFQRYFGDKDTSRLENSLTEPIEMTKENEHFKVNAFVINDGYNLNVLFNCQPKSDKVKKELEKTKKTHSEWEYAFEVEAVIKGDEDSGLYGGMNLNGGFYNYDGMYTANLLYNNKYLKGNKKVTLKLSTGELLDFYGIKKYRPAYFEGIEFEIDLNKINYKAVKFESPNGGKIVISPLMVSIYLDKQTIKKEFPNLREGFNHCCTGDNTIGIENIELITKNGNKKVGDYKNLTVDNNMYGTSYDDIENKEMSYYEASGMFYEIPRNYLELIENGTAEQISDLNKLDFDIDPDEIIDPNEIEYIKYLGVEFKKK